MEEKKKGTVEEAAEKTGEVVGKGVKTGWGAVKGLGKGILPTTLSTDAARPNVYSSALYRLLEVMSKFMALGLSLEQVVAMTTSNPAQVIHEEQRRGSIKVGMPADISIIEPVEGDFVFHDRRKADFGDFVFNSIEEREGGTQINGKLRLVPRLTIKSGVIIEPDSSLCRL